MADRPIIFSAPMVRALLDGRKSMTRRKAWREATEARGDNRLLSGEHTPEGWRWIKGVLCKPTIWQKVEVGDLLIVREPIKRAGWLDPPMDGTKYVADGEWAWDCSQPCTWVWKRSTLAGRFMPYGISRLTLEVNATRMERLLCGSLGDGDAIKEGLWPTLEDGAQKWAAREDDAAFDDPTIAFNVLWDSLHGKGAFYENLEVVALTFKCHQQNIDARQP